MMSPSHRSVFLWRASRGTESDEELVQKSGKGQGKGDGREKGTDLIKGRKSTPIWGGK